MPLKLTQRHGSPFWYIRGTVRGEPVDESTRVTDRSQAETIRAKREWEIIQQQIGGRRATATFLEAAVGYMEGGGNTRFLKAILKYFGTRPLSEIKQLEVEDCAKHLYPGRAKSTINRQVFTPISAVMQWGAARGLCEVPAFERPPQPRGRVRHLSYEEADRLLEACSPHLRPVVTFMLYQGARVGEVLSLQWREVDLQRAHATLENTKNGDRRGVPLHPIVVAALANLKYRDGAVFRTDRRHGSKAYAAKDDSGGQIKTAFRGACKRAKIDNFRPHDCRHTWATWHYAENRDLNALMVLGGWRTPSMVFRYAHVNVSNLASGVHRLGENRGAAAMTRRKP
jgi:integrase